MSTHLSSSTEPPERPEEPHQVSLSTGETAHLVPRDDGWSLEIKGARQSHVGSPDAPPALAAVRWMLYALGGALPQRSAHLGGGLLTLPRTIAHRRPGAEQVVIELEPALVKVARERFGVPDGVTLRCEDARAWLDSRAENDLDAVIIDIFTADRIPPAFTSLECFQASRESLSDTGRLVINSVAGPDLSFTRRELATMQAVFEHVALIVQGSALHGLRFGNATLIGSPSPLDVEAIRTAMKGDPSRAALVTELDAIVDGASPVTDADELWSPVPDLPDLDQAVRALDAVKSMQKRLEAVLPSDRDPDAGQ